LKGFKDDLYLIIPKLTDISDFRLRSEDYQITASKNLPM
jgi:hypothetical protein